MVGQPYNPTGGFRKNVQSQVLPNIWPDGSWAFSRHLGDETIRILASISTELAVIGFVAGGIGLLLSLEWWRPVVMGSAAFSAATIILFWDGTFQNMDDNGGIGLLIDLVILSVLLIFRWPSIYFWTPSIKGAFHPQ